MTNPYAYYEESPDERQGVIGRIRENAIRPVMRLMIFMTVVQAILGTALVVHETIYMPPSHWLRGQDRLAHFLFASFSVVPPILTTLVLAIALSKKRFGAVIATLILSVFPLMFGICLLYAIITEGSMISSDDLPILIFSSSLTLLASVVIVFCILAIIRYVSSPDVSESENREGQNNGS